MERTDWLAERFEQHRPRLRAVAYRMLGSMAEAEDAVQEAWLRSRRQRREEPSPPELLDSDLDPEQEALLADSVGLALLVVLDRLSPGERLAFVLHDMFELPFDEIAGIMGRTPAATRQLASRARRRVNGAELPSSDPDLVRRRQVVDAFYAASRAGDFDALVQVLDPDVVLTSDLGADGRVVIRGAAAVARQARGPRGGKLRPVLVDGAVGALIIVDDQPFAVLVFTVVGNRIVAIDGLRDPARVRQFADAAGISAPPVTSLAGEGS